MLNRRFRAGFLFRPTFLNLFHVTVFYLTEMLLLCKIKVDNNLCVKQKIAKKDL